MHMRTKNGRSRSWPSARISPTRRKPNAAIGGEQFEQDGPLYLELGCGRAFPPPRW